MRRIEVYSDCPPADITIFIGGEKLENEIWLERDEALDLLKQLSELLTEEVQRTA